MKKIILTIAVLVFISSTSSAMTAREIMQKVDDRNDGTTLISRISLTTFRYIKKDGKNVPAEKPRIKVMDFIKKDYGPKEKDHKSISIMLEPKSEKGIGFLQYDYEEVGKNTDQWMFLSAMGKVKRIVAGNDNEPKTGSFFGSEFNYEDMESYNIDDFTYKIIGSENYKKNDCWVIETTPVLRKAKKSNYSRAMVWVNKETDMILKSVLFNRNGKKEKKLYYGTIESIDGILIAKKVVVNNIITKRRTTMLYKNVVLNKPVEDDFLTQRSLTDKGFRDRKIQQYTFN